MTPAERQLVTELFDRLATLEDAPRDPDAERTIRDGLRQAPNAVYALVQTALVQDEALKQADDRIQQLEAQLAGGNEPPRQGGFLDTMRDSIFGRQEAQGQQSGQAQGQAPGPWQRGSVPRVRPADAPIGTPMGTPMGAPPAFGGSQPMGGPGYPPAPGQMPPQQMPPPEPQGRGGSFLGTAAAAAAGVIGGSMLLDGIRSMTGHKGGGFGIADQANAAGRDSGGGSPWGNLGGGRGSDDLARQAGVDDVGRSGSAPSSQSQGLMNESGNRNNDPFANRNDNPSANANADNTDADFDDQDDDQDMDDEDVDFDGGDLGSDE